MRPAAKVSLGETPSQIENRECRRFYGRRTDFVVGHRLFETAAHEIDAAPEMLVNRLRDACRPGTTAAKFCEINSEEVLVVLEIIHPQIEEDGQAVGKTLRSRH